MADEIHRVSNHVDATTGAVVAMKAAVVLAEKEGADHVCQNVNRGFFSLMHSQISQKIAAKQSRTEALYIELSAQKKRLLAIKSTMERDYARLAARYSRLFSTINKALKQRIFELDQPAFDFAQRDVACNTSRNNLLTAIMPICQIEGITAAQQIASSNLKNDARRVIEATGTFLSDMAEQKVLTDKILLTSIPSSEGVKYMPVAITESKVDNQGNVAYAVTVPEDIAPGNANAIKGATLEQTSTMTWSDEKPHQLVQQEFCRLVGNAPSSQRIKDMALKLYEASTIKTLKV